MGRCGVGGWWWFGLVFISLIEKPWITRTRDKARGVWSVLPQPNKNAAPSGGGMALEGEKAGACGHITHSQEAGEGRGMEEAG